ncbi:Hygromycin-Sensitive 1 [Hibiscus trionum]|uniref:Hygromycin-Sensitive 1 n=1 Tax=Hibiscus trionum TaxID=183268 RepID=A0A9W7HYF8_HIBTR|nr:Hygromycin-Sensitive 1 [Hibiscus trionum]
MDGVGSTRLGRATARYGSTAVFNGPVRKWKKKWVHVSPSSTVKHSQSNGGNSSASTSILLCRWTPLSSADSGSPTADGDGEDVEQLHKRKFRYTPVAVLEEERKQAASAKQVENEAKKDENETKETPDRLNMNEDLKKETQESNTGNLDLGLCLKGHEDAHVSADENEGHDS